MAQPQPWYPPSPSAQKSNTTLIIVIVLVVVIIVGVIGAIAVYSFVNFAATNTANLHLPRTASIVNGLITVPAGKFEYYQFIVPVGSTSITVGGSFTASGGRGNDIEIFVMDNLNFVNWENGHQSSSYYDSGQLTTGSISATLPSDGTYDLVYSNTFSTLSSKNVQTTVYLYYTA